MRLFLFTCFLLLVKVVLGIPQDDIFTVDWQTVQTGIPFSSIMLGERLISLTNKNAIVIQNITNGNVLYRYVSETLFTNKSSLVKINNNFFASSLVSEHGGSKITIWNVEPLVTIQEEVSVSHQVVGLFSGDLKNSEPNVIGIESNGDIDLISKELQQTIRLDEITHTEELQFTNAKLALSTQGSRLIVFESQDGSSHYITIGSDNMASLQLRPFSKCKFAELELTSGLTISVACLGSKAYKLDEENSTLEVSTSIYGADLVNLYSHTGRKIKKVADSPYYFSQSESKILIYDPSISTSKAMKQLNVPLYINTEKIINTDILLEDMSNSFITITTSDDMVVRAFHNGNITWERDESVAFPKDAVIINTDEEPSVSQEQLKQEKTANIFTAYVNRFKDNVQSILHTDFIRKKDLSAHFGYLKRLVVLTENGKIAIYETHLNETSSQKPTIIRPGVKFDRLYKVNNNVIGVNGERFYHIFLDSGNVTPCEPQFIQDNFKILNISEHTGEVLLQIIQTKEDTIYTVAANEQSNAIMGYFIDRINQSKTWTLSLPQNETLLSIKSRSYDNNKVASSAVVLPDRKVLYKYLIPNTAAIISYNDVTKEVVIRLTDIVTGKVYETFTKETDDSKSVKSLFEENFIILVTQDSDSLDAEITVIDMFESLTPDLKKTKVINTFDSFGNITILPEWSSRSYLLEGVSIRDITLTYTKNNIASKWIIASSTDGAIMAIPKQLLDGTRPLDTAAKGSTTGLIYQPYITPADNLRLSHYRKLISNSERHRLLSVATELESTSVIVSVDTDIFTTMVKPSSSFDTISGSFNKKVLIMTVISLVLGILYCRPLAAQKKLKDIWRKN